MHDQNGKCFFKTFRVIIFFFCFSPLWDSQAASHYSCENLLRVDHRTSTEMIEASHVIYSQDQSLQLSYTLDPQTPNYYKALFNIQSNSTKYASYKIDQIAQEYFGDHPIYQITNHQVKHPDIINAILKISEKLKAQLGLFMSFNTGLQFLMYNDFEKSESNMDDLNQAKFEMLYRKPKKDSVDKALIATGYEFRLKANELELFTPRNFTYIKNNKVYIDEDGTHGVALSVSLPTSDSARILIRLQGFDYFLFGEKAGLRTQNMLSVMLELLQELYPNKVIELETSFDSKLFMWHARRGQWVLLTN